MPRAGVEYVDDFREVIFRKHLEHLFGVIFSPQLHVFRDLSEYYNKVEPLRSDVQVAGLGEDEDHALVVLVPSTSYDSETLQLNWTLPEVRVQLPISAETRVLELPLACTLGSGMGRSGKPMTLFCRPHLLEQWKEIYWSSIRKYALLWIAGPPGTGKSCAALAFAYALRPSQWDVIWLHLSRMSRLVSCVWLQEDKKITCILDAVTMESQLSSLLRSTSSDKNTVVFVDGYYNSVAEGNIVCDICIEWRLRDVIRHRLVCVTSMYDHSNDFRRELTYKIPATVALSEEGQHDMQMAASAANSGEEGDESGVDDKKEEGSDVDVMMFELDEMDVYNEMKFDTVSWSFEDNRQAVQDETFFSTVRSVFPPYHESEDENEEAAKINELLERSIA